MSPRKDKHSHLLLSYTSFFEMPPDFLERPLPYHAYNQQTGKIDTTLWEDHHPSTPGEPL